MSTKKTGAGGQNGVVRDASVVGSLTLLSRVAGLARDQVTAFCFGAGPVADAFFVAFRIPNFLRRLLAEGALTPAFVPVFAQKLKEGGTEGAAGLFRGAFSLLALFLAGLTALGMVLAPQIVAALAPGFVKNPEQMALTVTLARILFPYILLMSLTALAMGALNTLGHFTVPALAPVALNLAMILGAVWLSPRLERPIMGLAAGALLGGVLQLGLQLPLLWRAGSFLRPSLDFRNPAIWKMLRLMGPAALGGAAYQVSVLINTQLVSFLPEGSVSWLYYADRLVQFPMGIFSLALATAVLPDMARRIAANDPAGFRETLRSSLGLQFLVTFPAMVGLMAMSRPLVELLFQRGNFDPASSRETARALWAYVLGLPFMSAVTILARAFYSVSDTKTPAVVAAVSLALGLLAALVLMGPLRHVGLALASSLTSMANFAWLAAILRRQGHLALRPLALEMARYLSWSILMGLALWPLFLRPAAGSQGRLVQVVLGLALGLGTYLALSILFRCPHLAPLRGLARRLRGRRARPGKAPGSGPPDDGPSDVA
ncbi:MAG: murein biosynthesis integral membrane protein MurJ [Deltaproteobacteria bacterium]|nr:murein biosynthesis integral membrane protein MurJ [Deltaproteobacteria bacterium]